MTASRDAAVTDHLSAVATDPRGSLRVLRLGGLTSGWLVAGAALLPVIIASLAFA
jgi:hypothetical protein